jgi:hypothetical protein
MAGLLDELALSPTVRAKEVEQSMQANGLPPEGMHHAILAGFREVHINNIFRGRELNFKIVAGPGKGQSVTECVWSPKGEDDAKDARMVNRMRLFAHRLGLLKKVPTDDGKDHTYQPVPGKHDFLDVRGAECIIVVKHEDDEYENKKGVKVKTKRAILEFEGLYEVSDKRAEKVLKAKPNELASMLPAATSAKPAAKADEFDDL